MRNTTLVWVGIGGNQGQVERTIAQVLHRMHRLATVSIRAISPCYYTEPVGRRRQPWFINGVIGLQTYLGALALLHFLHRLEQRYGRRRYDEQRWGSRPIDLDILFYGSRRIRSRTLTVPHPRLGKRRFVLQPLADVAPVLVHPTSHKTVARLLQETTDLAKVKRYRHQHRNRMFLL